MIKKLIRYTKNSIGQNKLIKPNTNSIVKLKTKFISKGIALISYGNTFLDLKDDDSAFDGHSSKWELKKIVEIFLDLGYDVDAISPYDTEFIPQKTYDVIFDIHYNLCRFEKFLSKKTITILYSTGSYPEYAANREIERVNNLVYRKKMAYKPKRICDPIYFTKSLDIAKFCFLIGNDHTLSTFPHKYQKKIRLTSVTYSNSIIKDLNDPLGKEFLWFYGYGAVHKGLDILLDFFSNNSEYILNIVGNIEAEKDFVDIYNNELYNKSNIKYHGFLSPVSIEFQNIITKSFCFIAPSCSESISTAVITCLNIGLYPIYSIDNGLELNKNGYLLKNCNYTDIESAIDIVINKKESEIKKVVLENRKYVQSSFSRNYFTNIMTKNLKEVLFNGNR